MWGGGGAREKRWEGEEGFHSTPRPRRSLSPSRREKKTKNSLFVLPHSLFFTIQKTPKPRSPLRPELRAKLRAVEGDVCRPDCGLSAADLDTVRSRARFVVHCAASISFFEHVHVLLEQNYVATRNAVDLAMRCQALAGYVHVSTAYVNSFLPRGEYKWFFDFLIF